MTLCERRLSHHLAAACCLGLLLSVSGCDAPDEKEAKPAAEAPAEPKEADLPDELPATGEELLRKMVGVYKQASTYADAGTVRLVATRAEGQIDELAKFSLTFERPNKIRLEAYQSMAVSDGQQFRAAIGDLPNQVLQVDAPEELTFESIYSDRVLASALGGGFAGPLPQLMLLLGEDPVKVFLQDADSVVLGEPGNIGGRNYYRVKVTRADGIAVFWIDQKSLALRRIVFPTSELRQLLSREGTVDSVSLVADFHNAQFNGPIDPTAFKFEAPTGAQLVPFFIPPHPAQLLGGTVPPFAFVDLEGNEVTPDSLAGKIVVFDFWATWCEPCRKGLPNLETVRQAYKDNPQVVFYAVSVDQPEITNKALTDTFGELAVGVPILRDTQRHTVSVFNSTNIPTMFILDAKGVVQHYEVGVNAELATVLPKKIDQLLAGEDIYQEPVRMYQQELQAYQQALEGQANANTQSETIEIPQADIAPRSAPKTLRISPLWENADIKAPGNILVVPTADGPPRLLVVDAWKSVAEVGLDGKTIGTHLLNTEQSEVISGLRTAVGADGKRYFIAMATAQQRFHLLDDQLQHVRSYPEDALENPHTGIADVQLGDLDGDGTIEALVGYWGVVGIQNVSLEGQRLWGDRSVTDVLQIALDEPDPQGQRRLVCSNRTGSLALFDAGGKRLEDVPVPGQSLYWIKAADLSGDGKLDWLGLAAPKQGENVAVGLDLQGQLLWKYPLPLGAQRKPIEPVISGRVSTEGPGVWLLPGADGSIHILGADGTLVDHFNHGAELTGLATAQIDGNTVLLISTAGGLEAWKVQ